MAHNLSRPSHGNWSFDPFDVTNTIDSHEAETKTSTVTNDNVPLEMEVDSAESSRTSSTGSHTLSLSTSVVNMEEPDNGQQAGVADSREGVEKMRGVGDQNDNEATLPDVVAENKNDWIPTHAELYAIVFPGDDDYEIQRHGQDARESRDDIADTDEFQDGSAPDAQNIAEVGDENEENINENTENVDNDTNPQPQNPWGMSDAEVEALMIDQDRQFGYIRDRDSAPKPFTCVCGEASMDPSPFINLTCPDNCVRCVDCLNANVRVGLESKKNYPPQCCVPIDFENVLDHLEPNLIDRWLEVRAEYEDIAPVYCSVKTCSLYLPRTLFTTDGKWAECRTCGVKTCTACLCPKSQHDENSATCPERLDQMDKDLIKRRGWKACPRCREMIERTEGCDHMECECGQEFCYGCGRSYMPPMPCNCHGQNQWAEQIQGEADPRRQQEIMDRIANGEDDDEDEDQE